MKITSQSGRWREESGLENRLKTETSGRNFQMHV